ncbi:winged helix-turn-helix domain-containing protein [Sphingomonas japonica]|nr:winged helix-turn-helix domain-containing protein [Sphingomonas japonica]
MQRVASDIDSGPIAAALQARGLILAPIAEDRLCPTTAALLLSATDDAPRVVGRTRGRGWRGPLMLLGGEGATVTAALDAGADDAALVDAPPHEIAARLAARVRGAPIQLGGLVLDPLRRSASRDGRDLGLLPREFALLLYLAERRGIAVPRATLLRNVWGLRFDPGTNVVAVHVSRLRARLDAAGPAMLHTDRGRGYRLSA